MPHSILPRRVLWSKTENILLRMGGVVDLPDGSQSQKPYSMFMDVYAASAGCT